MILGYSSFVLSSVKNLREHYIRVHKVFWQIPWKLQGHFFRTYKIIENTNFWKIGNLSSEAKILSHSSFVLLSVTNLRELFIRVHKVFWQILWKLQGHFFRTYKVIENTKFWKIGNLSGEELILGHSSFVLSIVTNLTEYFIGVHKVFWQKLWKL